MVTAMVYSPKIPPKTIAQTSRVRFVRLGIYCLKHRNPTYEEKCEKMSACRYDEGGESHWSNRGYQQGRFEGFADAWLRKQEKIDYDNCNGKMG